MDNTQPIDDCEQWEAELLAFFPDGDWIAEVPMHMGDMTATIFIQLGPCDHAIVVGWNWRDTSPAQAAQEVMRGSFDSAVSLVDSRHRVASSPYGRERARRATEEFLQTRSQDTHNMANLTLSEATALALEGKAIQLHSMDATGTHHQRWACWLEDRVLVHFHPTDDGTCRAPDLAAYSVALPGECYGCSNDTEPLEQYCRACLEEHEAGYE